MPGRHVQFAAGCYYHLYNRGANRSTIFPHDDDFRDFLERLRRNALLHETAILAWCLMPNHFHLLVRQEVEGGQAGHMLQCTCNGYAQAFNRRHTHCGTVFQGRFHSILVDSDEYLRCLCRYIHTNPVKDGFALRPELWPYSNYADWVGERRAVQMDGAAVGRKALEQAFVAEFFGCAEQYRVFVGEWANRKQMPEPLAEYVTGLERGRFRSSRKGVFPEGGR
jgi:REP element-mobilizing transposase RayT